MKRMTHTAVAADSNHAPTEPHPHIPIRHTPASAPAIAARRRRSFHEHAPPPQAGQAHTSAPATVQIIQTTSGFPRRLQPIIGAPDSSTAATIAARRRCPPGEHALSTQARHAHAAAPASGQITQISQITGGSPRRSHQIIVRPAPAAARTGPTGARRGGEEHRRQVHEDEVRLQPMLEDLVVEGGDAGLQSALHTQATRGNKGAGRRKGTYVLTESHAMCGQGKQ